MRRGWPLLAVLAGCLDASPARSPEATFSGGVAALIYEHCSDCHRPEGAGPFPLLTYDQVREQGARIARMTGSRRMPPWQPSRPVGAFAEERGLTDAEIALLRAWVDDGMPLGDPAALPAAPTWTEGWALGPPDVVVEMEEPYVVPADATEIFRNFVLPVSIDRPRWVRGVELRPGGPPVVHHATLAVDRTARSFELDRDDAGPGFDGMGSAGGADHPGGVFIGWTPGKSSLTEVTGLSWLLYPGSDLVARLHLRPVDRPVSVRTSVGIHFADEPPDRRPVALQLGTQAIDIPAGEPAYEVRDSFPLPAEVDVLSLYPHAHYLGSLVQVWAEPSGSGRIWLLEIPDWDFNWQDEYRFRDPVRLPAGTVIHMRYTYDNSSGNPRNPSDPPVRVTYGPRSVDEMADLVVQTLPLGPEGHRLLAQAADRKVAEIKLQGYRLALREGREDAPLRYNMGIAEAARGRLAEAAGHFTAAVRLDPQFSEAFINLGIVLHRQGRVQDALDSYLRAVELTPAEPRAHHNAGVALEELGRGADAERHFLQALDHDSTFALSHKRLGRIAEARGDPRGAVASYRLAVEHAPEDLETRMWLGRTLAASGDGLGALEQFRAASELAPDSPEPLLSMADLLAAYPDASLRRPAEAVRLAVRAVELTRRQDPVALFSLANAYRAGGDPGRALATGEEALAIARQGGPPGLVTAIGEWLRRLRGEVR